MYIFVIFNELLIYICYLCPQIRIGHEEVVDIIYNMAFFT